MTKIIELAENDFDNYPKHNTFYVQEDWVNMKKTDIEEIKMQRKQNDENYNIWNKNITGCKP